MQDSCGSTFDAFLKALLDVPQKASFGTKPEGPKIGAASVSKLFRESMANAYDSDRVSAPNVLRIHLAGLSTIRK